MSKQYRELDDLQTRLGIDRWHKVMGENVWDDTKVKEISVEEAMLIAKGLARGVRGDSRLVADTTIYNERPKESDAAAIAGLNKGIIQAYNGVNNINTPMAAFVGNG